MLRLGKSTGDTYEGSDECPYPTEVGNVNNGVEVTPGPSAMFRLAQTSPLGELEFLSEAKQDWQKGTIAVKEDTVFVHVVSKALPPDLKKNTKLRTLSRVYAHTDTENWEWNGSDRVLIHWPAGTPFQIMGSLGSVSNPYQRSCKNLKIKEPVTLDVNNEIVVWPYANVAVVLPPMFFSVMEEPYPISTPKQVVSFVNPQSVDQTLRNAVLEVAQNGVELQPGRSDSWDRNRTVFTSSNRTHIDTIKSWFDELNRSYRYKRYDMKVEAEVGEDRKRRRAALVMLNITDTNMEYKLTVSRARMYESPLKFRAHFIDLTLLVMVDTWHPEVDRFSNPFNTNEGGDDGRKKDGIILFSEEVQFKVHLKLWSLNSEKLSVLKELRIAFDGPIVAQTVDPSQIHSIISTMNYTDVLMNPIPPPKEGLHLEDQRMLIESTISNFKLACQKFDNFSSPYQNFESYCILWAGGLHMLLSKLHSDALQMRKTSEFQFFTYLSTLPEVIKHVLVHSNYFSNSNSDVNNLIKTVRKKTDQSFHYEIIRALQAKRHTNLISKLREAGLQAPRLSPSVAMKRKK
jgi:hypothetical protein